MEHDLSTTIEQPDADVSQLSSQWARVCGRLHSEVGELEYRNWLRQMTFAGIDGDEITVLLPTRFLCDWVRSRYGDRLSWLVFAKYNNEDNVKHENNGDSGGPLAPGPSSDWRRSRSVCVHG